MAKRKISAKDLLTDIRSGLDYDALSEKHGLSVEKIVKLSNQMVDKGMIAESELPGAAPPAEPEIAKPPPMPPVGPPKPGPSEPATEAGVDRRYSIEEFVRTTEQSDRGQGTFELESPRLLEVNLDGTVWTKAGSMIAYRGSVKFSREGILEHGVGKLFKRAVSAEPITLTKAEGVGKVYLADAGKKITILELGGETIFVNGNDILAFENTIEWDISLMKKVTAMMAGGLTNIRLDGHGKIAVTSHYEPLTLRVTADNPVVTDPNATVAWSGSLSPDLKTDVSFRTFIGRGSGESIQMLFQGDGFVVVQPFEEVYFQR